MSPAYWNLPKPGLIISVTGNADPFVEENELAAHDQPYLLFKVPVTVPKLEQKADAPCNLFVPVRRRQPGAPLGVVDKPSECSPCGTMSKRDHLSDVLCRIADYMTQSPADYATWGKLLVVLAEQAKQTDAGSSGLKVTFSAKNASGEEQLSFAVPSEQAKVEEGSKQGPEDRFGEFMNQLNEPNFCSCVEVKLEKTAQQSESEKSGTTEKSPKVLKITKLLEDKQVFDHSSVQDSGNRVEKASANQSSGNATSNPVTQDQSGQPVGIALEEMSPVTTGAKASNATKTSEEGMPLHVPVFYSDTLSDVQRRIENLSLAMFPGHGKPGLVTEARAKEITTRFLTLPQPIWQKSTLILQQSADDSQSEQLQLFSEVQFDKFKMGELESKSVLLLRTQGSGCYLTKKVVQRILHQVAFLLPLQFGSVWVISGGTNKGIMQVHCACLALIVLPPHSSPPAVRQRARVFIRQRGRGQPSRSNVANGFDRLRHHRPCC